MAQRRNANASTVVTAPAVTISAEEFARLTALAAKGESRSVLSLKVSSKGGVSLYGLQRMPITLYVEQWERLVDYGEEIAKFLVANAGMLDRTADTAEQKAMHLIARDAAGILRPEEAAAIFEAKSRAATANGANPAYAAATRNGAVTSR